MAYKRLQIIEKQPGVPIEHSVVTRRLGTPTIFTPEIVFDVSNLYPVFVRNSSLGPDFYYAAGKLEVSTGFANGIYLREVSIGAGFRWDGGKLIALGDVSKAYVDAQDASIVNTLTTLYLTEAESNAAYVYKAGDTMTGDLNISGADIITSNGTRNTELGVDSLASADGSYNVAIGYRTLSGNAVGTDNTIVGCEAGNHMSGSFNSALGSYALGYYGAGNNNIGIGFQAGRYHSAGDNNIFIGYRTQGGNNTTQNEIVIGSGLVGKGSNTVNIGNTDVSATYLRGTLYVNDVPVITGVSQAYVDGSLSTKISTTAACDTSTSLEMRFDKTIGYVYGTITSPLSGAITMSTTGALLGVVDLLIHKNNSTNISLPAT